MTNGGKRLGENTEIRLTVDHRLEPSTKIVNVHLAQIVSLSNPKVGKKVGYTHFLKTYRGLGLSKAPIVAENEDHSLGRGGPNRWHYIFPIQGMGYPVRRGPIHRPGPENPLYVLGGPSPRVRVNSLKTVSREPVATNDNKEKIKNPVTWMRPPE